jgi:quercetin dioxygenase-like cupin family protein
MRIGELDRIASPDLQTFESYARRNMPFAMTGAVQDWAARSWTIEQFEQRCADNIVAWEQYPDDRSRLGWWNTQRGPFREYLERMRRGEAVYVAGPEIGDNFPQMMTDLKLFPFIDAERQIELRDYRVFLGKEQRTEIHYHPGVQSILIHVAGAKRKLVLYPPSETAKLYPFRWYQQVQMSRVLPSRKDEFPKFKDARYYEYDLEPGDAVFIPIHWWHWAQSYGETLAIALFFGRKKTDKYDFRLELRDRASAGGERLLSRLSPRLSQSWRRFTERTAWGG